MKYILPRNTELTTEHIVRLIQMDASENARKIKLYDYYKGKHKILARTFNDPNKPNNRVVAPFPRYITTIITGYFMGEPVQYTSDDEPLLDRLNQCFRYNDESSANKELARHQSIFGVGAEMLYMDDSGEARFKPITPIGLMFVYQSRNDEDVYAAIRYWSEYDLITNAEQQYVELHTAEAVTLYSRQNNSLSMLENAPNPFGMVDINPYWNNSEALGDYEAVMSEIDGYDSMESDTINEADEFADAYLMLAGMQGTTSDDIASMKEDRVLVMPEGGTAEWLIKSVDNTWQENEKKRLSDNIHKFSFCPDLTDESFAGNASGVAIEYKLIGLEEAVGTKESEFEKGLRRRIEMLTGYFRMTAEGDVSFLDVNITFTRNIPHDLDKLVAVVKELQGILSRETRLSMLPLDIDIRDEIEKTDAENLANYSLFAGSFNEEVDNGEEEEQ